MAETGGENILTTSFLTSQKGFYVTAHGDGQYREAAPKTPGN